MKKYPILRFIATVNWLSGVLTVVSFSCVGIVLAMFAPTFIRMAGLRELYDVVPLIQWGVSVFLILLGFALAINSLAIAEAIRLFLGMGEDLGAIRRSLEKKEEKAESK